MKIEDIETEHELIRFLNADPMNFVHACTREGLMEERWDVSTQEFLYRMSRLGIDLGLEGIIRHLAASWRKAKET